MNVMTDVPGLLLEAVDREVARLELSRQEYVRRALKAYLPVSRVMVAEPAKRVYPRSKRQIERDRLPIVDKRIPVNGGLCPECLAGEHCNGTYELIDSDFRQDSPQFRYRWLCACDCGRSSQPPAPVAPADPEAFPE